MVNEKLLKIKELFSSLLDEQVEEHENYGSVATEQAILYWDGEEDLKAGDNVYVADENGENRTSAEDGDYKEDDGTVIKVKDGKVEEIVEPEEEEDPEGEPAPETPAAQEVENELSKYDEFKAQVAKYEESYDEKVQKIAEAVRAAGYDGWVYEAGDDYAVVEYWDEETDMAKYIKFQVAWDEEGNASVSDAVEVKQAFVPAEEEEKPAPAPETPAEEEEENKPAEEEENFEEEEEPEAEKEPARDLEAELDELKKAFEDLKAKLAEIEEAPADKPAAEEFEALADESNDYSKATKYGRALRK